jgi:hypothetical protein
MSGVAGYPRGFLAARGRSRFFGKRGRSYLWIARAYLALSPGPSVNRLLGARVHRNRQNTASGRLRKGSALFS